MTGVPSFIDHHLNALQGGELNPPPYIGRSVSATYGPPARDALSPTRRSHWMARSKTNSPTKQTQYGVLKPENPDPPFVSCCAKYWHDVSHRTA